MNKITLSGIITSTPVFSHEVCGEKFFEFKLKSERKSEVADELIVNASETLLSEYTVSGGIVKVVGEIRTYNIHVENGSRLHIYVFAKDIMQYDGYDVNEVEIDGFICKPPVYRETPKGREITDIVVACNRPYGKSDYIPTIAWGRNARRVGDMVVGTHIIATGRLQSREYLKQYGDGTCEDRVAYDLSVSSIKEVEEQK